MKMQELFTDESTWTKRALARDADGNGVSIDDPSAVCYCLGGAIFKCYSGMLGIALIFKKIRSKINHFDMVSWNNDSERTFEDIKNLVTELDI